MSTAAPRAPVSFGQYKLIDRLAVGGMAELFLARQSGPDGFEKPVVIKRIRPHLSRQPAFVRMFLNEARLAAQLNHPNIVQIHDLGKVGDSYYIGMEYLFGRDMRRVVPKAESLGIPFPMVYALKIASSVCEGLHYAHQKVDLYGAPLNIVHRDVTPENIFVCFDGTVKVLDFGIAKAANRVEQTRAGELRGKLSYLSPEQCLGKPLDHRSDIFSLGSVLYEWLTGFKLFTGESDVSVMRSIVDGKVYAPSYFRADIPEPVEAILMKALERDRDKRYPTAWHFQQDLDRFLNTYDFTPSSLHLSNFLKQLFLDELEEEQKRLRPQQPAPFSAPAPTTQPELESVLPVEEPSGSERIVAVPVTAAQLESLEAMARKHGVPVGKMVGELLSVWLKYR
ncbi:serine/threonine protein kinase [Archangium violaceum]|uniref:Serine/threonine protein kinase n=1 Tax=Archangium violaceum Cb vi76 TaxID=1406225 RepID=A0A084SGV7_9BACT|nr:serine/threonine-protein kinase [Archangium violaceum]KFA87692.1 serine/threonine protein kinase [Archangium violaceum Cb vi76]